MNEQTAIIKALINKLNQIPEFGRRVVEGRITESQFEPSTGPQLFVLPGNEVSEPHSNAEDLYILDIGIYGIALNSQFTDSQVQELPTLVRNKVMNTDRYLQNDNDFSQYLHEGDGIFDIAVVESIRGGFNTDFDNDPLYTTFKITFEIQYVKTIS